MVHADDTRIRLIQLLTTPTQMSLQLSVSEINDDTSLIIDLGLDSIQILEFSIAIEEEFGIDIAKKVNISDFDRFANLVALVSDACSSSRAASAANG
jgi:acyl carrier protein